MAHRKIHEICGEHKDVKDELKGINHKLTLEQAQLLLKWICRYKRWPLYTLKYSNRECKSIFAWCDVENRVILIHKIPETVQIIIHEITHIKEPEHTPKFQKLQLNLINLYKNKFCNKLFDREV